VRTRILLVLNVAVVLVLGIFLLWDYANNWRAAIARKKITLDEEASALHTLLRHYAEDPKLLQQYIDEACMVMQERTSPGHHIAVEVGGKDFQSSAHHRPSAKMLQWMKAAAASPDEIGEADRGEIVVGMASGGGMTIYISEYLFNVRAVLHEQIERGVLSILVLAAVLVLTVNWLVSHFLARPLDRLVETVRRLGHGEFGVQAEPPDTAEMAFLFSEFNRMSLELERADDRRRRALARARNIQLNLLPETRKMPGIEIEALYAPAEAVAGDYYDILPLPDGGALLCVADVTGHGVPAAMEAAMLKVILQTACEKEAAPEQLAGLLNRALRRIVLPDEFATLFLMRWSPAEGAIRYASAGHEPARLIRASGEQVMLGATGPPLNTVEDPEAWTATAIKILPGDRLVAVSDGIAEAASPDGEFFGRERLAAMLEEHRSRPLRETIAAVQGAVTEHLGGAPQADDMTMLLVEFEETVDQGNGREREDARPEGRSKKQ